MRSLSLCPFPCALFESVLNQYHTRKTHLNMLINVDGATATGDETAREAGDGANSLRAKCKCALQLPTIENVDLARFVANNNAVLANPTVLREKLRLELMKGLLFQRALVEPERFKHILARHGQKCIVLWRK